MLACPPYRLRTTFRTGNGCIGNAAGHCGNDPLNSLHDVQTFRGHALIPATLYDSIMSTCTWTLPSLECDALLLEAQLLTNELDVYDIYNTCRRVFTGPSCRCIYNTNLQYRATPAG